MGEKILWLVCLCRGVEEVGEAPPEEVVVLDCEAEGATKRRRANEEPGLTFESPEAGRRKGTPISTVVGQKGRGRYPNSSTLLRSISMSSPSPFVTSELGMLASPSNGLGKLPSFG
jgi:hypothetical protein